MFTTLPILPNDDLWACPAPNSLRLTANLCGTIRAVLRVIYRLLAFRLKLDLRLYVYLLVNMQVC